MKNTTIFDSRKLPLLCFTVIGLMSVMSPKFSSASDLASSNAGRVMSNEFVVRIQLSTAADVPQTTKLAAKLLGTHVELSRFSQILSFNPSGYNLNQKIILPKVLSLASGIDYIENKSTGSPTPLGLQGNSISESRGGKNEIHVSQISKDKKRAEFYKNHKKVGEQPVASNYTDLYSLAYLWLGRPVTATPLNIDIINPKSLHRARFQAQEMTITFKNENIKAIQFSKVKNSATDSELTILVRKADGFPLRVDLGLSSKNGISATMYPLQLPKEFTLNGFTNAATR